MLINSYTFSFTFCSITDWINCQSRSNNQSFTMMHEWTIKCCQMKCYILAVSCFRIHHSRFYVVGKFTFIFFLKLNKVLLASLTMFLMKCLRPGDVIWMKAGLQLRTVLGRSGEAETDPAACCLVHTRPLAKRRRRRSEALSQDQHQQS